MALQHLRSSTANKRPTPGGMSDGQLALNTNVASPGLFFKDSTGALVKVGPVHVGTTAPNSSPAVGGQSGNSIGEQWLDTTGGTYVFKVWDGSAWRSETGTFVDVNGDVMTGALGIIAGSAGSPGLYISGDTNTGIYSPGADQVSVATGGTERLRIDSTGQIEAVSLGTAAAPVFSFTGDTNTGIYSPGADQLALSTNGTAKLSISSTGLHTITAGNNSTAIQIRDASNYAGELVTATDGTFQINARTDTTFTRTGSKTESLRITSAGLVGIGTSTPTTLSAGNTNLTLGPGSSGAEGSEIHMESATHNGSGNGANISYIGSDLYVVNRESGFLALWTNQTPRLYIDSSGRVGIGTTSPDAGKLHILNGADAGFTPNTTFDAVVVENGTSAQGAAIQIVAATNGVSEVGFSDSTRNIGQITYDHSIDSFFFKTAGVERARIDSSGRLLVGTSSSSTNDTLVLQGGSSSSTGPCNLRLRRGSTPGSGDTLGGTISFENNSGNTGATISAGADATWGTNDYPGRLVFSTTADGASSPTEAFRVNRFQELVFPDTSSSWNIKSSRPSGAGQGHITFNNGGSTVGTITTTTTATAYNTSSDYRLKENITLLTGATDRLKQLPVHRFNFIADPDNTVDGFIAHEAQVVVPEAVTGEKDAVDDEGNPVYQGIDQSKLVPLLTAALQEAIGEIESLKARLTAAGL